MSTNLDDSAFRKELEKLQRNGRDMTVAMRKVANVLVTAVEDVFESEGFGSWKRSKRAELQGGKTLQDTGNLAGSIRPEHSKREAAAYTDVPYGRFHVAKEHGGILDDGDERLRDYMAVDTADVLAEIEEIVLEEMSR